MKKFKHHFKRESLGIKGILLVVLIIVLSIPVSGSSGIRSAQHNDNGTALYQNIEFKSLGVTLRGRLYLPETGPSRCPVIIMAHGFTTTINGMTADKYAERYREAGYAVLLYDHRNLGVSDGEPRQDVNFWVQSRGYIDCIDFAVAHPALDAKRIAVWGASLSAREAFLVGSVDERVKAVVALIPGLGNEIPAEDLNQMNYSFAKEVLFGDQIMELSYTVMEQMPIVSSDQMGTPSVIKDLTAYRWFIEYGGRFSTNWRNMVSYSTIDTPENFHVGQCAPHLKAPILMIVATNDEMNGAKPEIAYEIFNLIKQPKEWVDIEGGHFGLLYYPSKLFDKSSHAQIEFLNKYL